jgi:lipoprotein-anchoring transpeptidase ErfK/SrfK
MKTARSYRRELRIVLLAAIFAIGAISARALTADEVNAVTFVAGSRQADKGPDPFIVKAQVLLSRRSISPGVIDGVDGENFRKAVAQFRRLQNLTPGEEIDELAWLALSGETTANVIGEYTLTGKDVDYAFADAIPRDYARQAKMKRLSYTSAEEMLGERFHMSEALLRALNPGEDFGKAGDSVRVASVARPSQKGAALRVEAVKSTGMVVAYGEGDKILASYPATIGSEDNPSPSGDFTIERVARNPNYTYDPDKNFQQGRNTDKLTLPPGPNGPVGTVWIALSKPTFGIHGTPEPSRVSKTNSHGCVRLTNWDAEELADLVKPGVAVRFID